jgi:hypothetical protein
LEELGAYLVIGTQYGNGFGAGNVAKIFKWDRVSTTFEMPIDLKTRGVRAMINYNNVLYVIAGLKGNIYATDGSSSSLVGKVSAQMLGLEQEPVQFEVYRNGIAQMNNKILFGGGTTNNGNPVGVFSFNPSTGGVALEYTLSTGNDGSSTGIDVYSLYADSDNILYVGYADDTTYGIDKTSITRRYATDSYIITGLYRVGQDRKKRVFTNTEIVLSKDLETSNSVVVSYRTKLNENFTTIGTMTNSYQKIFDKNIETDNIQVKIDLRTSSGTGHTPELMSVRLY